MIRHRLPFHRALDTFVFAAKQLAMRAAGILVAFVLLVVFIVYWTRVLAQQPQVFARDPN
jgi:hypothetical protein